jgi:hypothetical protein
MDILTLAEVHDFLDTLGYHGKYWTNQNGINWDVYLETERGILLVRSFWGNKIVDWFVSR